MHVTRMTALLILILIMAVPAVAQPDLRAQLFAEAEKAMQLARDRQADVYAPKSFSRGLEAYNEADDYFKRGKPIEKIRDRLGEAVSAFTRSTEAAKLGEKTFSTTMAARTDAQKVDAPMMYTDIWRSAEESFRNAAVELEDGNLSDARKDAAEAENLFRKAELESIKAKYLAPARGLLKQAEASDTKDNAPKTLERARRLVADAEARFAQNRYNNAQAQALAEEARYEAAHAIYLNRTIALMKNQDKTYEDVLLASEEPLKQIAAALSLQVAFDNGYEPATQKILAALRNPDTSQTRIAATVRQQDSTIAALKGRLAALDTKGQGTEKKSPQQNALQEILGQISTLFSSQEGSILVDGNNVVLRMYGVTFTVGKNTLEPDSKLLLSRVAQAIAKFPSCQVTVEGHTETIGSELANQRNSEERAEVVARNLRTALPSSIAITSQGYGGSRPIGPPGRNKRIDVVIVPEWAIVGK